MEIYTVGSKIEHSNSNVAELMWSVCFKSLHEAKYWVEEEVWLQYCEDFKDYLEDWIDFEDLTVPNFVEWKSVRDCWAEDTRLTGWSSIMPSEFAIVKAVLI